MSNLSDNEILTKINKKRDYWINRNREERIKLEAKRDGYEEAVSDIRGLVITKELDNSKKKEEFDKLYKAYEQEFKNNDIYIKMIILMAKTFIDEIDTDKYYDKYNNMTESDLIDYFKKEVEKHE